MVFVRQTIVADASTALSQAVCIATRYSAVRRQFGSENGGVETQVIDYKTQQSRLFPLLASAYAFRFVGEWLKWLYTDVTQKLQANDFSTLPEAHACTAGLKSLTTSATADAIEECRKLCGGHGYLSNKCQVFMSVILRIPPQHAMRMAFKVIIRTGPRLEESSIRGGVHERHVKESRKETCIGGLAPPWPTTDPELIFSLISCARASGSTALSDPAPLTDVCSIHLH
ncbi:Hypothetical predicted protein [Prunus dulcis]|uniref:Acyl-CoA oxidase C-alpha1 domain-containing protein n=1 Tax=Prunus dulcis TaxID=3755 RepID=A0A5E4GKZ7_PRUDU|nr:Hypothetical predicted protein [Prunus dulcis]